MTTTSNRLYTMEEVAAQFNLAVATIRQYTTLGRIKCVRDNAGLFLGISQEQIDEFAQGRVSVGKSVLEPTSQLIHTQAQENEVQLIQDVISSVFTFLETHHLTIGLQSLREISAQFRIWDIQTPDGLVRVLAENGRVSVLAEAYQKQLEEQVQTLRQQLQDAQMGSAR